jgi:hypothetical protein
VENRESAVAELFVSAVSEPVPPLLLKVTVKPPADGANSPAAEFQASPLYPVHVAVIVVVFGES